MHAVAIMDRRLVDVPDAEKGPADFTSGLSLFLSTDHRAITIMPLLRGAEAIGALSVVRRLAGPLSDRQMELLKTFSDQAVIAIEILACSVNFVTAPPIFPRHWSGRPRQPTS